MNIRNNAVLRQKLAAEYVLGTLRGGARRRFEGWMHQDADLRNITAEWQQRLSPMAEFAGSVVPPKAVWTGIERRLNLKATATGWHQWILENIAFWRGLGIVSTGVAALLLAVIMTKAPDQGANVTYVASLNDDKAEAAMVVTADTRNQTLNMRLITNAQIAADKSLELWAVPKSGNPRSLGVLVGNRGTFKLPDTALSGDVVLLAVTVEPKGGSPKADGPTGPIVYKGNWIRL